MLDSFINKLHKLAAYDNHILLSGYSGGEEAKRVGARERMPVVHLNKVYENIQNTLPEQFKDNRSVLFNRVVNELSKLNKPHVIEGTQLVDPDPTFEDKTLADWIGGSKFKLTTPQNVALQRAAEDKYKNSIINKLPMIRNLAKALFKAKKRKTYNEMTQKLEKFPGVRLPWDDSSRDIRSYIFDYFRGQ